MLGPLWLDPLIRPVWGSYDPLVLSQLDPLMDLEGYQPKLYRVPIPQNEMVPAGGYVEIGVEITPGDLIAGFLCPPSPTVVFPQFTFQLEDLTTGNRLWNEAIPAAFISNYHPTFLDAFSTSIGAFWNLLVAPYPVIGSGLFRAQIQNKAVNGMGVPIAQRIEVVIGALEVKQ